jgi:autotransporter adhesin
VSSLQNAVVGLQSDVNKLTGGVAAAMATAGLPQAYLPGHSMVAMAGGVWGGQAGYAIGISHIMEDGHLIVKAAANGNTNGNYGGTVGVGYQW